VATSDAVEAYPACDAGRVVYMYAPVAGGSADIRLYDIGTGGTSVVSNQFWNEWGPAISGDRVVWQAWPSQPDTAEGIQIMGKNLTSGETFTVTSGPGHQTAPVISGSVVAWEDARSDVTRVWWRDLGAATGERQVDGSPPGRQVAPALSGRTLAYQSDAPGVWNIYWVILE
jgi:Tol biopolymer transport system component